MHYPKMMTPCLEGKHQKSVQNHVIMVSGIEKEYVTGKVAKMDFGGNGEC
jgi:hypothetical protein